MAKCFMCGEQIPKGILCEKCDKPRRGREPQPASSQAPVAQDGSRADDSSLSRPATHGSARAQTASAPESQAASELDVFPKAPLLPFPVESASPAVTSVVSLMVAAGVPAILVGADRIIKFVSDEAKQLFAVAQGELASLKAVEEKTGLRIGELSIPITMGIRVRETGILYSLVPLSGGASGAVLVFRYADVHVGSAPFVTYVQETVLGPLRALRDSLLAAAGMREGANPLLSDAAAALDHVLSSLELAPAVGSKEDAPAIRTVTDVVHRVADRFRPFSELKGLQLQVDVRELKERFRESDRLEEALGILMDNALHYVPAGGQVVIGARWMEHKGKPLLLFFVMDNGPVVPESLRQLIFEPAYVWDPNASERTGRSLFNVREFAVAHSGSVWVESKTGKACTFFLRVRPDGVR